MKIEPKWLWNRLRAMSVPEVIHRSFKILRYCSDLVLFRLGRQSLSTIVVQPAIRSLFDKNAVERYSTSVTSHEDIDFHRSLWISNTVQLFDDNVQYHLGSPVQWLTDPKTKITSPKKFGRSIDYRDDQSVGEIKYLWEIGRHQFLVPMAIRASFSKDEEVREKLESHFRSWLEQNPIGMGIHWCSSLELALRLISWCLIHSILQCGGMKNGIFDLNCNSDLLRSHIYHQVKFIVKNYSRFSSSNNHLIGELTGVWVACNVFDLGIKGKSWRESAFGELEREAHLQTHSDGVNKEQAIYYHLWSTEYFWLSWLVAKRYNHSVSTMYEERIVAMYSYMNTMCSYASSPAQIGDSDDGVVLRFDPDINDNNYLSLLSPLTNILNDERAVSGDCSIYSKNIWYLLMQEDSDVSSIVSSYKSQAARVTVNDAFESGGYYVFQGKDCRLMYKAGPFGYLSTAAHGHADALSIVLAIDNLWWLIDPGTYTYHSSGEWRNYFRSTMAHNTLCVDEKNQSVIAGDFLWERKTEAHVSRVEQTTDSFEPKLTQVTGSHSGYADRGVVHERTVKCDGERVFELQDLISLSDHDAERCLQLAFHFHPHVQLQATNEHTWIARHRDSAFTLTLELPLQFHWELKNGQESPIVGWYSQRYGVKEPSNTLIGRYMLNHHKLSTQCTFRTLMTVRDSDKGICSHG